MFNELSNFGLERTSKEAVGFYIVYFFVGVVGGAAFGGLLGLLGIINSFEGGVRVGSIVGIIYCVGIGITMANQKGTLSSGKSISLIILSGVLAIFIGALGGLLPIAYLSTTVNLHTHPAQKDVEPFEFQEINKSDSL